MSEYQYYEFAAVDQLLTEQAQSELRSRSTRATITASCFINEYHWGNLKGEPLDWVERFFDAHVYSSSWGNCRLLLRIPRDVIDAKLILDCVGSPTPSASASMPTAFEVNRTAQHSILDWSFNDDSGEHARFYEQADGPGWMARLLPLRDELLRGDTRPLYLGWLARLGNGALRDSDREPPLPNGLQTLTPAQASLAEFMMLDPDWLAAAAETSPPLLADVDDDARFDPWLLGLTAAEMRDALRQLLRGNAQETERGLRTRFLNWDRTRNPGGAEPVARRTVAEIDARRDAARALRLRRERAANDAAEVRRIAERRRYLDSLIEHESTTWERIDTTLQRGSGHAYGQAFQLLQDLAEAYTCVKNEAIFRRGLVRLMAKHGNRGAWVKRLMNGGFMWTPKT
jgi:hypothetical protein